MYLTITLNELRLGLKVRIKIFMEIPDCRTLKDT